VYSLYLSNKTENGVEETLIYDVRVPDKDLALISPSLEIESGNAGSLDFTMPPNHLGYNLVDKMRTEVIFKQNDKEMWRGRVLNTDTDFYNQMKVECEGELAYLNDTYQPQKEYDDTTLRQFLEGVISIHNQKVTDANGNPVGPIDKRFKIGAVYVEDVGSASVNEMFRKTDYDTTLQCLKSVASTYKAYFVIRKEEENGEIVRKLDFVKDFVDTCSQSINFGENLLDYSKSFTMEDLCTVAMPIGAKMEDKAGDEITLYDTENNQPINYLGSNGQFGYDPNDGYRYARVCYLNTGEFKTGDKIYVSVAQTEDTMQPVSKDGIWCFAAEDGSPIGDVKVWSGTPGSMSVETYEKYELTIPAGAHRFRVGGNWHYQPELKVYRQKAKERVDECYTIESVPSYDTDAVKHREGDIYIINKALFEKYGWHEKKLSFGDLDNSQKLNDMTVEYLTKTQFEQMKLDLTAFDLSTYNMDYEQIWINTNVPFYSPPHGIAYGSFALPCTKMTIKLDSPEDNEYTLGYSSPNQISDTQSNVSADISHLMEQMPAISATLASAKQNATEMLDAFANAGRVVFVKNPNNSNEITEILIYSGSEDPAQATKRWVWNMGGLGYQERVNGAWQTPIAMTMDGSFVANRITTGSLYADRIRGGTLKLGHTELLNPDGSGSGTYTDGNIEVKDNNGNNILTVEKLYGLTTNGPDAWMRIKNGHLYGSGYGEGSRPIEYDGEQCSGIINLNNWFDGAPGLDIRTRAFGINSDSIYVSDGLDGRAYVGLSTWVEIGHERRLKFVKGLLWGTSHWDSDENDWVDDVY
jgi:hypothetical protein